ncbi:hypothetical protein KVH07_31355 [Streptomyces olivaceus]|uniref:hypothetical protein n=1 Tax=Streptomyces olivaceus TaxID=47716 RepID=UPI001CCB50FB|nr:hypothetical protein [Streptomyces olivaceus]MBZ6197380.1 hypothetical protein [Streptomyces olivaceus]MBZ6309171.1 hypothetical protein [Streptomyces olivaceus]MBZ6322840.1 hypothetical protein [Streptomyces olivaceus]
MTGSTPPWKRRFSRRGADQGPLDGPYSARDDERGPTDTGTVPLEAVAGRSDHPATTQPPAAAARRRAAAFRHRAGQGVRNGGARARAALAHLADRIIELAPRVPVRDLATLRRQFPGLGPEELADRLVAGATKGTATVGAGIGAAAMLPVPPAMPTELAAEVTGVAAIELKLIAELHEVYGVRPPGSLAQRSTAYLNSWSDERGVDVSKPSTLGSAMNSHMKRQLRQQIMKRMVRNLPNLMPFMVGAAVGAVMNRRDTGKLAARIRTDLRKHQVAWSALENLPALEKPQDALDMRGVGGMGEIAGRSGDSGHGEGDQDHRRGHGESFGKEDR